jgi:hypothetical protein
LNNGIKQPARTGLCIGCSAPARHPTASSGCVGAENFIHVRDQAVFADHATGASLPSDAVLIKFDRFG